MKSSSSLAPGVVFGLASVLLALVWVFLRLGMVHLTDVGDHAARAQRLQSFPPSVVRDKRGAILDRHGRLLAHTESLPTVALDPSLLDEPFAAIRILEDELQIPEEEIRERLRSGGRRFSYLRRRIRDRAAVERVAARAKAAGILGIIVQEEPVRVYPCGATAAHLLGFTNRNGTGVEGLEALLDRRLKGRPGQRTTRRDGLGRRIVMGVSQRAQSVRGESVRLTLDLPIQTFAENAVEATFTKHHPKGAIAAVLDVKTGELLALAVRPNFDPNDAGRFGPEMRRNRFFTDALPPGSTFKPLVMGLALDAGLVLPDEGFDCSGGFIKIGRRRIREDNHHDYGHLTAAGVIAQSSNVGMVQVGTRLGIQNLYAGVRLMGFGSNVVTRWPGQTAGIVNRLSLWNDTWTVPSVSIGQEISVTSAQLLAAYGAVAAGGVHRPLRLVLDEEERPSHRVISPEAASDLLPMLAEVMTSGTGRHAAIDEYRLGGKTGTAQKFHGPDIVGHIGSFVCVGPLENPRLAVIVLCDEPEGRGYGSQVGAPYAVDLIRRSLRYLGVPASPRGVGADKGGRPLDAHYEEALAR